MKDATIHETAADCDLRQIMHQQSAQIAAQQKQIESLIAAMKSREGIEQRRKTCKCWEGNVRVGVVDVACLINTGAEVSTIHVTESFF